MSKHSIEYIVFRATLDNPITGKSYREGIIKSIDRGYYKKSDKLDLSKVDKEVQAYQRSFLVHWKKLRDMPEEKHLFANLYLEKDIKDQEEALKVQFVKWVTGQKNSDLRLAGHMHGEKTKDEITRKAQRLAFWKKQRTQK